MRMNKLFLLLLIICFSSCEKNNQEAKYFDPVNISKLNLTKLDNFWEIGSKIDTSFHLPVLIENDSSFIDGIRLNSEHNEIRILVYKTQNDAVKSMEKIIKLSACVIIKGTSDIIEGNWWYSLCEYGVSVNKHNTLIEVSSNNASNDGAKDVIHNTANELAKRVDNLSQ